MHRRFLVAYAVALALLAVALPAVAVAGTPATVSVRIEGQDHTLLPTTTVTTSNTPVPGSGASGTSAAGAIELATGGNWDRQCFTSQLMGESHTFAHSDYWAFWINNRYSSDKGICDYELGAGDQVLMLVDISDSNFNPTVTPLELTDVPARADVGAPFFVTVLHHNFDGSTEPVEDATVAGDGVSGVSDAAGHATLTAPATGTITVKADKAGFARSPAASVCVSHGDDGTCGTTAPGGAGVSGGGTGGAASGASGDAATVAYAAPRPALLSVAAGERFRHGRGPRTLSGHVDIGTSPLLATKLRLLRRTGGDCSYFSGSDERWHRTSTCGKGWFFKVGESSPDFSYLLPSRLPAGSYTLDASASDTDHVREVTTVRFRVS
jgi:hypothetical protein